MVRSSYRPTNKRFRDRFQEFAGTKTKKGHFDQDEDTKEKTGTLKKIDKSKLFGKGWYVEINGQVHPCTYSGYDGVLPEGKETDKFLYPKQKLTCDVAVNKKEKKYDIQRIENLSQSPTSIKEGTITIQNNLSSNDYKNIILKNESTNVSLTEESINLNSANVNIIGNNINETINGLQTQINDLQDENMKLKAKIEGEE